jgi:hypothetical protein
VVFRVLVPWDAAFWTKRAAELNGELIYLSLIGMFGAGTTDRSTALIQRLTHDLPRELALETTLLHGGLEAAGVERVVARYVDERGRRRVFTFVVKRLHGTATREALIYERLVARVPATFAPRLLAVDFESDGRATLFLEAVPRVRSWPWSAPPLAFAVLERLAHFHDAACDAHAAVADWQHAALLESSAHSTLEYLESLRSHPELSQLARRSLRATRRLTLALPRLHAELLRFPTLPAAPIHGDLHPGNVIVRKRARGEQPVFIDWGRSRVGSALEDVSSWLHSLGYVESEARRRHDTLLQRYLLTRGLPARLSSDLRAAYWAAGACNALAGALRYHLWVACSSSDSAARTRAAALASDWLRVVRRADALC